MPPFVIIFGIKFTYDPTGYYSSETWCNEQIDIRTPIKDLLFELEKRFKERNNGHEASGQEAAKAIELTGLPFNISDRISLAIYFGTHGRATCST